MKTIHLKCGHNLSVKTWPSKSGLAKVRHHYKKFHPERMRKMTKKSLATKKRKGLIYYDREKGKQKIHTRKEFRKLFKGNKCNPKRGMRLSGLCPICGERIRVKGMTIDGRLIGSCRDAFTKKQWLALGPRTQKNPAHKSVIIYDKLLGIEAHKSHGKFKGQNFFHDFKKDTSAMVIGNPDGSLTIRSNKGKRLWKKFKY